MDERNFEIGARKFKLNKINAFDQFHIVRRLAPLLGELMPVALKLKSMGDVNVEKMTDEQLKMFSPIMTGLAKLSDEDSNRVLLGLCSSAEMFQPASNNWARIAGPAGLMFQDLELPELLQIAGRAFMFNLQGFFQSAPQVSHGGK
jgi:hypothetical protein